ncbi:MAG: segregation/condensation protein A [Cyanobacteria bacterium J06641_5]
MTVRSAREAIALLIELAQTGEIDPWDVDVILAIDRFLGQTVTDATADLPQSGQAFLWASMLVLLKADTLEQFERQPEDTEELPEEEPDWDEMVQLELVDERPIPLEHRLRRRTAAPAPRKRRVTLQEFIHQIQEIAAYIETAPPPTPRPAPPRQVPRREAARTIAALAHNENLTELAGKLENLLLERFPALQNRTDWLDLERLLEWWTQTQPSTARESATPGLPSDRHERVGVFWALLLLSAQSKVELVQERFYQDLSVRLLAVEGTIAAESSNSVKS